jgi:FKBP-type peptidyl-prolyl cis-trans isomerase FklB
MRTAAYTMLPLSLLNVLSAPAQDNATANAPLVTTVDQASYAVGMNIGRDIQRNGLSGEALIAGIRTILANAEPRLTAEQCQAALMEFDQQVRARRDIQRRAIAEKNKQEGEAFLARNKEQAGVVTLPSGLQYQVLKPGAGPSPAVTDTVRTHYHGTLIDGTVFDSSVQRREPAIFPVGGVIRGWSEALQLMRVGDKWRLFVPSELAYGSQGVDDTIAPNSVLIFEVELLGIE